MRRMRGVEVHDPHLAGVGDEDILRIEITVHDAVGMRVRERSTHGANDRHCVGALQGNLMARRQHAAQRQPAQHIPS